MTHTPGADSGRRGAHPAADSRGAADSTPGAAFGIPAGARGEEVIDALFQPGGALAGVDEELAPYLEAADAPEGMSVEEARQAREQAQAEAEAAERADQEALRQLVAASLLPAGDLDQLDELLADIDADDEWEQWDSEDDEPDAREAHRNALEQAAHGVDLNAQVRRIEEEILSRAPEHQVQPSLERVEMALDFMAQPQETYRIIHITGTNGKTSTARMCESLLRTAGLRTGRFTSPHLSSIRERISLDGQPISPEGFIAAWEDVAPFVAMVDERSAATGGPRMSFFEVLTVMAYAAFADYPVDVAIMEVGMGGRWDATNVANAQVEIITPIGLDHTRWLGSTIAQIAHEKAGIITPNSTVVTARQLPEATEQIAQEVASTGALWWAEQDDEALPGEPGSRERHGSGAGALAVESREVAVGGQLVSFRTPAARYEDVFVPLHGEYQAHNALLALSGVEALLGGQPLDASLVADGFAGATSPGRLEVLSSSPTVIVDAGHNPHGVQAALEAVDEVFHLRTLVAVVGAMADKDVEGLLSLLEPACDAIVCVGLDSERAMTREDLEAAAAEVFGEHRVHGADDLASAIDQAATLAEQSDGPLTGAGVLVIGSVVLAGAARDLYRRR